MRPEQQIREDAVRKAVAALGPRFNDEVFQLTRDIYRPTHRAVATAPGVEVGEFSYGPAERHRLDVFAPLPRDGRRPIVLFVHGGGFVGGDKRGDDIFYTNVGHFFARHDFVGATMNYRLAPAAGWPAGAEDVELALQWLAEKAASFGGDPDRILIVGQSAGACHVASYLFDAKVRRAAAPAVKAAVLMSGFFKAEGKLSPNQASYFGEDDSQYGQRSPSSHVAGNRIPILVTLAEFDPPAVALQSLGLAAALTTEAGRCPPLVWFEGHNHVSTVMSLGTADTSVANCLLEFLQHC